MSTQFLMIFFKHGLYRILSRRFPLEIYYEILNNVAFVVAVLPMRRDPEWRRVFWKSVIVRLDCSLSSHP